MFQVEFSSHISLSVIILLNDDYRINFKFRNFGFYMCNFFIQFWIYWHQILKSQLTALLSNMRTLKFEGQHSNAFFHCCQSNVGQVFPAYDYCRALFCCLITVHNNLITAHWAVVRSWEEPPNIWLTVVKNAFCQ